VSRLRTATLVHEGGNRFVATTGSKRSIVYGDDLEQNELSPVETIVVSLAACTAMDVAAIAAKKRQVIERYAVHVEAEQRDEYPQILTLVRIVHEVAGPGVEEAAIRRAIELSATKYCPVNAMLSAGATEVHHGYRVIGTGPDRIDVSGEVVVTGPYRRPDPIT
jgi:putative redox protein